MPIRRLLRIGLLFCLIWCLFVCKQCIFRLCVHTVQALTCTIHCKFAGKKMPFTINYEHYTAHLCKYGLDSESFPHISFSIALCMLTWPLCSFSFQYISPHIKANSVNIYLDRVRTAYVIESWCTRTFFYNNKTFWTFYAILLFNSFHFFFFCSCLLWIWSSKGQAFFFVLFFLVQIQIAFAMQYLLSYYTKMHTI